MSLFEIAIIQNKSFWKIFFYKLTGHDFQPPYPKLYKPFSRYLITVIHLSLYSVTTHSYQLTSTNE